MLYPILIQLISPQITGFFNDVQAQGIPIQMTSGFRTTDTQADLTGNQYGGAPAGSSLHEAGFAFDTNYNHLSAEDQQRVLGIANQHNLEWGGNFSNPDPVHFYADPFNNLDERRAHITQVQAQYRTLTSQTITRYLK